jgi:hypothetical protein
MARRWRINCVKNTRKIYCTGSEIVAYDGTEYLCVRNTEKGAETSKRNGTQSVPSRSRAMATRPNSVLIIVIDILPSKTTDSYDPYGRPAIIDVQR